jgi:hypothetical protein
MTSSLGIRSLKPTVLTSEDAVKRRYDPPVPKARAGVTV